MINKANEYTAKATVDIYTTVNVSVLPCEENRNVKVVDDPPCIHVSR